MPVDSTAKLGSTSLKRPRPQDDAEASMIYRPQKQLAESHGDRVCAYRYDKSTDDNPSTAQTFSRLKSSNVHRTTYNPLSYVPSNDSYADVPLVPARTQSAGTERPKQPVASSSAGIVAKPPPSGRPMTAGSPRNPYLKSNSRAGHTSNGTGGNSRTVSSESPKSFNQQNSTPANGGAGNSKPVPISRPLARSSPINPYAKKVPITSCGNPAADTKPSCARSIIPASPVNPYLKVSTSNSKPTGNPNFAGPSNNNFGSHLRTVNMNTSTTSEPSTAPHKQSTTAVKNLFAPTPYQNTAGRPQPRPAGPDAESHRPINGSNAARVIELSNASESQKASTNSTGVAVKNDSSTKSLQSSVKVQSSNIQQVVATAIAPAATRLQLQASLAPTTTLASIRPPSWTSTTSSSSNPTFGQSTLADAAPTNRPELPGEVRLPPELVYDPDSIKPIKDEYRNKLTTNASLDQPLLNGWTLYRHQKRAILKGLMKRRVILALDMGLGKTLIGCVWSKAFKASFEALKILVVCPVTLKKEWKRTAETATGLEVDEETTALPDSLHLAIHSWAKIPEKVDPAVKHFVAVFDEAHAMQAMESNRTQAALKLVFDKRCVGVLLLTGTPMKNGKPSNLFPLLKAVKHPLGTNQKAYERHFCQGRMTSFGRGQQWIAGGSSNLKQLHRLIETNLLHMTKDEYLKDLPPLTRETRKVPISARCQRSYNDVVRRLGSLNEALKTNQALSRDGLMGLTQDLRVICAFAKIRATVEIAKEILAEEPAVVIFTNFAKAATAIHTQLAEAGWHGALLTGDTAPKKRQELVDGFQNEIYPAFVSTFGAGGVGITLTQARTVILLDRPWTPGELLQAEDRIRRIGQQNKTRSVWVSAFEFDKQLDGMLEEKHQATTAVLTKSGSLSGDAASASINIPKLVACLLSKASIDLS